MHRLIEMGNAERSVGQNQLREGEEGLNQIISIPYLVLPV